MCYTKEESLKYFIIGSLLSTGLIVKGDKYDKHIGIAFIAVILMQLAEYLMWSDIECKGLNQKATIFAYLVLILQPLSILLAGLYLNTLNLSKNVIYVSIILVLTLFIGFFQFLKNEDKCSKIHKKDGHLVWPFIERYFPSDNNNPYIICVSIYLFFLIGTWLFMNNVKGIIIFLLFLGTLLHYRKINLENFHSIWCHGSVKSIIIYLVTAVLYNYRKLIL